MVNGGSLLQRLDSTLHALARCCGEIATHRGERAYLVGGCVRDLYLDLPVHDVDIVVVGEGMAVAQELARAKAGELLRHHAFQTAKVEIGEGIRIDVATARREDYPRPGSLPAVVAGGLEDDLGRRDFTINTMAIDLHPSANEELIDLFEGRRDLDRRVIRILHQRSFADDPTRILRALRFAQRFNCELESDTTMALTDAVQGHYLDTVSGERIRRELRALLCEAPVEGSASLQDHGVLAALQPSLRSRSAVLQRVVVRQRWFEGLSDPVIERPTAPRWALLLTGIAADLEEQARWQLARRLRLQRQERQPLIEHGMAWTRAREQLKQLFSGPDSVRPSEVDAALRKIGTGALLVGLSELEANDAMPLAAAVIQVLEQDRWVQPWLSGDDLLSRGCPPGPDVGVLLTRLRAARLDGETTSAAAESELADRFLRRQAQRRAANGPPGDCSRSGN